jgi:hypothetical protein
MTDVSPAAAAAPPTDGPKGIGGWLILPTIGTVVSPFAMAFWTYQTATALDRSLSTGLNAFITLEALFNFALTIAWIVAIVALFKHKRIYPKLFVTILVVTLVGTVLDLIVAASFFNLPVDAGDVRGLARSVIGLAIWGPYMYKSKRVQNTFVVD